MPNLLEFARNPVAYVARRWTPAQRTVERATLTALVLSVVIVVTGGVVRLTGSGLGCDTWPKCSGDSLVATPEMGLHGAIEFGNRLLTYVLCAAVGWAIVAVRSAEPRRRSLSRLAWSQFWLVAANGVLGGVTVLLRLNPYTVAAHFLLASVLITVAAVTWLRVREGDEAPRPLAGPRIRQLAVALTAVSVALIVVGTMVTGAGPHAGDSSDVPRMGVDWEATARAHALLAWAVVGLTVLLWLALRAVDAPRGPLDRTRDLFLVLLAQGAIGYVQYFTELPEVLVAAHLLGSCLVWIAVLRALLSLRERGLPPVADAPEPVHAAAPAAEADRPAPAAAVPGR
ncbi:heme A synthase [Streptomyces sp. DH37]|uniref:COX15/CtaA family protein n=1 Tax=Streptomyces sp. DH37 TaxID=3040122 RepID=UPI0024412127|nr:COX15/CtaA family protein [Streptomyces sp. DH37]MDG9705142.1 COX15/CtaA family protein [Streptomyces sp. DH37]